MWKSTFLPNSECKLFVGPYKTPRTKYTSPGFQADNLLYCTEYFQSVGQEIMEVVK